MDASGGEVAYDAGNLTEVVQKLSGKPRDRSLQLLQVPRTTTDTIELEIPAVAKGPRHHGARRDPARTGRLSRPVRSRAPS
jgi:hypothetical protein